MRVLLLTALFLTLGGSVHAHCDALDGPVVVDARRALASGEVGPVLKWIQPRHEGETRRSFQETLRVRQLGEGARALADRSFFETLVRLHRAGEGAPYTGLKPAGHEVGAAVTAADRALESGSLQELDHLLLLALRRGLTERLRRTRELRHHADQGPEEGRRYVASYVDFVHYVKGVYGVVEAVDHGRGEHAAHAEGMP